ncbi:MAG: hypothetical protein K0B05_12855, partial [Bacteroidales bacterium]|nr:hypothetical protein [Bacteroidales bacterium]
MKSLISIITGLLVIIPVLAQPDWENEEVIGINKEAPHSHYIPYMSVIQAVADIPGMSPLHADL